MWWLPFLCHVVVILYKNVKNSSRYWYDVHNSFPFSWSFPSDEIFCEHHKKYINSHKILQCCVFIKPPFPNSSPFDFLSWDSTHVLKIYDCSSRCHHYGNGCWNEKAFFVEDLEQPYFRLENEKYLFNFLWFLHGPSYHALSCLF